MVARVSSYEVLPERLEEFEDRVREALSQISEMEGLRGHYLLVGQESNRAMIVTFWDGQDNLAASRVTAARLRSEAVRAVDAEVLSVDEFAVASNGEHDLQRLADGVV
jgi:heme-degrading monooxygenase HmoA